MKFRVMCRLHSVYEFPTLCSCKSAHLQEMGSRSHLTLPLLVGQMGSTTKQCSSLGTRYQSTSHTGDVGRSWLHVHYGSISFSHKVLGVSSGKMLKSILILSALRDLFVKLALGLVL